MILRQPVRPVLPFTFLNILSAAAAAGGLFFFFTNGIPLIQAGLWDDPGSSKKAYLKIMRTAVLLSSGILGAALYLAGTEDRGKLAVCRLWQKIITLPPWSLASLLWAQYALTMSAVGIQRHQALATRAFDLGIFDQAVWTTSQGHFLFSSIKDNICLLGDHFSPILALLAPLYWVWADPRVLIVLQAMMAGACLFPLLVIVRDHHKESFWPVIFLLAYCLYAPTRAALHEDFHPEVLVEFFLLGAFIFLQRKKWVPLTICLLIAVSAKENMFGIAFAFGLTMLIFQKNKWGFFVMLVSCAAFWICVSWLIPGLSQQAYLYQGAYRSLLSNGGEGLFQKILSAETWEYFFTVLLPFIFLPLFHLQGFILALPVMMQNILAESGSSMRSFNYHYTTGMTPFLFAAGVVGASNLIRRWPLAGRYQKGLACLLIFVAVMRSGPSEYFRFWSSSKSITPHVEVIRDKLRSLPQDRVVLTHNNLIPQLSRRMGVYQFDYNTRPKHEMAESVGADTVILEPLFWEPNTLSPEQAQRDLTGAGFQIEYSHEGFTIMRKRVS